MKIVLITSYASEIPDLRGDMIEAFKLNGHEVIIFGPERLEDVLRIKETLQVNYRQIYLKRNGKNPFEDIFSLFSILLNLLKEKPDIVFSYTIKPIIYGSLAAKVLGIKKIYSMMSGLGSVIRNEESRSSLVRSTVMKQLKLSLNLCNKVMFHNKDDAQMLVSSSLIDKNKVSVINGSGVNMNKFIFNELTEEATFLFVGRIIKDKGILEYIEAAKIVKHKYPHARIQILGSFDSNPTAIRKEDIEHYFSEGLIEYLGSTYDVRPFLVNSTAVVLPSYHEGTPKSILEGMAVGRPIITTDAPGCRETVLEGVNGFLIPIKNPGQLAEKMIWMIENKDELKKMGKASLAICREKFDVKKVNKVILRTMELSN